MTEQGVVIVGKGETAKMLTLTATSVQDSTKSGIAYIKVGEPVLGDDGNLEEIPKAPLGAKYVRERLTNGQAAWT